MNRVYTGLLAFLIMGTVAACGGGDDNSGEESVASPTATPVIEGEVIDIVAANAGITPQTVQLQVGTAYVIRFKNDSLANTYRLVVERYNINLEPLPNESVLSHPFTESEAGEYPCFEFNRAIVPSFQCTLVFS